MSVGGVGGPGGADWGQIPGDFSAHNKESPQYTSILNEIESIQQGSQSADAKWNTLAKYAHNHQQQMGALSTGEQIQIHETIKNALNGIQNASNQAANAYGRSDPGFWNQVMGDKMSKAEALATISSIMDQIRNDPVLMNGQRADLLRSFQYSKSQVESIGR
jgi:hypothetical protein